MSEPDWNKAYLIFESPTHRETMRVRVIAQTRNYYRVEYMEEGVGGRRVGHTLRLPKWLVHFGEP